MPLAVRVFVEVVLAEVALACDTDSSAAMGTTVLQIFGFGNDDDLIVLQLKVSQVSASLYILELDDVTSAIIQQFLLDLFRDSNATV